MKISDYREYANRLSALREKLADIEKVFYNVEKEQRATKYAQVGRWVEGNLSQDYSQSWEDSMSAQQYESKKWMVDEIANLKPKFEYSEPCHIEVVGSWFGWPLMEYIDHTFPNIKQVDLYDKDDLCHPVMAQYKNHFAPKYSVHQFGDWFERTDKRRRQVIINTSGEHMSNISANKEMFKGNPLIIIMSNDYFDGDGHTHCVPDVEELVRQQNLGETYYTGTRSMQTYNRFMVIGRMHAESTD